MRSKLKNAILLGAAVLFVGCGGKFYSGDINKNGVKDKLTANYDKKAQTYRINFVENKEPETIFYGEGKNVSKPKAADLDGDGLEDVVFAFQERDSGKRTLFWIMNNTDSKRYEDKSFVVKEITGLPEKGKNINLHVQELANNTPFVIADYDIHHLERGNWVKYSLAGEFYKDKFDINRDSIGDFVYEPHNRKLTFMVSNGDKSYDYFDLNSDYPIRHLRFTRDNNVTVHKKTGEHTETRSYTTTDSKGNIQIHWHTVTIDEMRADTYKFQDRQFNLIHTREYEED